MSRRGCETVAASKIAMADAGAQTNVHLPHVQNDIVWTASSLSPIVDTDEEGDGSDDEVAGTQWSGQYTSSGIGVDDIDLLDAQQMAQVFVGALTPEANWLDGDLNNDENADLTDAILTEAGLPLRLAARVGQRDVLSVDYRLLKPSMSSASQSLRMRRMRRSYAGHLEIGGLVSES